MTISSILGVPISKIKTVDGVTLDVIKDVSTINKANTMKFQIVTTTPSEVFTLPVLDYYDLNVNWGDSKQNRFYTPSIDFVNDLDNMDSVEQLTNPQMEQWGSELLRDKSFEDWSSPDYVDLNNWGQDGGTLSMETTITHGSPTSAKLVGTSCGLYQTFTNFNNKNISWWKAHSVTFSIWCWCDTPNRLRVEIYDGVDNWSSYHSGNSSWEQLSVTVTARAAATNVYFYTWQTGGSCTSYFDEATASDGTMEIPTGWYASTSTFWSF